MFCHYSVVSLHKEEVTDIGEVGKRNKKADRKRCRKLYVINFIAVTMVWKGEKRSCVPEGQRLRGSKYPVFHYFSMSQCYLGI